MAEKPRLSDFRTPLTYDSQGNPLDTKEEGFDRAILENKAYVVKGEKIPVIDPDGRAGTIDSKDLREALSMGYKYQPAALQLADAEKEYYGSGSQQLIAGLEGLARGVTLGGSDLISTSLGGDAESIKKRKEVNEGTALSTELAGAALPAFFTGGSSVGASTAAKALRFTPAYRATQAGEKVTAGLKAAIGISEQTAAQSLAGKVVSAVVPRAAGSAVEGAIYGSGNFISEASLGNTDATAENLLSTMGVGALFGGGVGGVFGGAELAKPVLSKYIDKAKDQAVGAGKKIIAATLGVGEKDIDNYLSMKAAKEVPPSFEQVFEKVEGKIASLDEDLLIRKEKYEISKAQYDEFVDKEIAAHKEKVSFAKEDEAKFREASKAAFDDKVDELRSVTAVGVRSKVVSAMEDLQKQVFDESAVARSILKDNDLRTFNLEGFMKGIDDQIDSLKKKPSEAGLSAAGKLDRYKTLVEEQYGRGLVPLADAKNIIQGLDQDTVYRFGIPIDDDIVNKAKKMARRSIDQEVKKLVPEYAKQMDKVSAKRELLEELSGYGEESKALSRLHSIGSKRGRELEVPLLKRLEQETGAQFTGDVERFLEARNTLSSSKAKRALREGLKETQDWNKAQEIADILKNPKTMIELKMGLQGSLQAQQAKQAGAALEFAKQAREEFKGLRVGSLESKLRAAQRGKLDVYDELAKIKVEGVPVPELLEKVKTMEAFEKGFVNGSRNVNAYSILLGTLTGGMEGAGFGAMLGMAVDKFGPAIAKRLLDGTAYLKALEQNNSAVSNGIKTAIKVFATTRDKSLEAVGRMATIDYIKRNKMDSDRTERGTKSKQDKYKKRLKEMAKLRSDPEALIDGMARNVGDMSDFAPETASKLQQNAIRAVDFLFDKAPKDPNPNDSINPIFRKWEPSDRDLAKFERYYAAVDNPMTVLKDLRSNAVTPEQIEAIKVVYPHLYSQIQTELVNQLTELKQDLPYQKKLQLSVLFGIPVDATLKPGFVGFLQKQTLSARLAQNEQQGGAPRGSPDFTISEGSFKLGQGTEAPSDKIMGGLS